MWVHLGFSAGDEIEDIALVALRRVRGMVAGMSDAFVLCLSDLVQAAERILRREGQGRAAREREEGSMLWGERDRGGRGPAQRRIPHR